MEPSGPIAVVGMSCRFPRAGNVSEFWKLILSMEEAIGVVPDRRMELTEGWNKSVEGGFLSVNVDELDGSFFEMSRTELNLTDPQQRLSLEVSWEALEDARIDPTSLKGKKLGVFTGSWRTDYSDLLTAKKIKATEGEILRRYVGNGHGAIAGRLSYFYGGVGPSIATDSACSSSMAALALAMSSLRKGTSDVALAVGANLVLFPFDPKHDVLVAPDGRCKTFEQSADGYGRAEGIATLVLKRLSDALRDGDRVHSIILGYGSCNKSLEGSLVTPDVDGEAWSMEMALEDAQVGPGDVGYVEIHGTGTSAGDFTEFQAVSKVYDVIGETPLYIASLKANIGHPESCSGLAGVIKTTMALKGKVIPPHRKIKEMNEKLDLEGARRIKIPSEEIPWEVSPGGRRLAGVSSFGILGSYYHVILEDIGETPQTSTGNSPPLPWNVLTFSAKSEFSLKATIKKYLTLDSPPSIPDLAYSTGTTRAHLRPFRAAFVGGSSWTDVKKRLETPEKLVTICSKGPKICFLLTGQGSQYFGMGKELYTAYPGFRKAFDKCQDILQTAHGVDLASYLWDNQDDYSHSKVLYNQTGIFVMEYSMTKFLESVGITPFAVLGHSVGEFAAACVSGILSLESAQGLIVRRAKLLIASPATGNSAMLAVKAKPNAISEILSEYKRKYPRESPPEVSAMNTGDQIVLGGSEETIKRTQGIVESIGLVSVLLSTSHAFHSSLMDPILPDFVQYAESVEHGKPKDIVFVSSVSGMTWEKEVTNWPEYWRDVTRKPVDFLGGCQSDALKDVDIFLEVGPHPVLCGLMSKNIPDSKTIPTMRREGDEVKVLSEALSTLYTLGCDVNWNKYYEPYAVKALDLPFYQFCRKSYWMNEESSGGAEGSSNGHSVHPLLGNHAWTEQGFHVFDAPIDLKRNVHGYLNDHTLGHTWLFPAAGFVEIALSTAAILDNSSGDTVVVENLEISNPLGKTDKDTLHIQTNATPEEGTAYSIQIYSGNDSKSWRSQVVCSAYVTDNQSCERFVALSPEELSHGTSTDDLYEKFTNLGYTFGPDFQRLREFWKINDKITVFRMDLRDLDTCYVVHPVVIDAMIVATAFVGDTRDLFAVPVSVKKFTAYVPRSQDEVAYLHVTRDTEDGLAHILIVNESQDKVIGVMEGLVTVETSVAKIKMSIESSSGGSSENPRMLKQFWERKGGLIPSEKFLVSNLKELCSALKDDVDMSVLHGDQFALLGTVVGLNYQKALSLLGFRKRVGQTFTGDELADELRIIPAFRRFFDLLLRILIEDGVLKKEAGGFQVVRIIPPVTQLDRDIHEKSLKISKLVQELKTVDACMHLLPDVLQGSASILPLLFPSEENAEQSDVSALKFYQNSEWYLKAHTVMGKLLRRVLESFGGKDQMIRILEVGGGTGIATSEVIPLLESLDIPYHYEFTDISPAFFAATEKRIRAKMTNGKGSFHASVFDLEGDALGQGYRPFEYHVIVASMVLHATRDLRKTCLNLRKVSQGVVCIVEGEGVRREIDAVFGNMEGYWLYVDDVRSVHPNVDADKWRGCLESCGFKSQSVNWDGAVVLLGQAELDVPPQIYKDIGRTMKLPTWVIYVPEGLQHPLREVTVALRTLGRNVALVGNLEDAESWVNSSETLEGILYARGLEDAPTESILMDFLHLMQTVVNQSGTSFPRIVVPMRGAWFLEETDEPLASPSFVSSLWGLCKTLRSEFPAMNVKAIDLDGVLQVGKWLNELFPLDGEPQISYRSGNRHVLRLKDATKPIEKSTRTLEYPKTPGFQLALPSSCDINDLSFVQFKELKISESQVSVDVKAVGLNFKDVLCVLKPSDFFLNQRAFGMDLAGIITAVGSDVSRKDVKVGDRVIVFNEEQPFSSSIVVESHSLIKLPEDWSLEDGATVTIPFFTAYYCLLSLAQMTSQDTVLIHTGSGGVGIAAIQLAKIAGAKIVATAGSKRKRAYLKSLGVNVVLNSRTLDFGEEIMKATNGRGVDIVLNTLTGEGFVETSLKACNASGRFVEISKLNIWTEEEVATVRPDVKYWTVNITDLDATTLEGLAMKVEELMWAKKIVPLPRIQFPCSGVISAVKYLQQGQHIGKVVLKLPTKEEGGAFKDELFSDTGLYLITGGFGGIGIEIAKWMVQKGARHLAL